MATNKPVGDNARKGAVRKRSQIKIKLMGNPVDQTQQKGRQVHGREEEQEEIQRRVPGKEGGVMDAALAFITSTLGLVSCRPRR